MKLLGVFLFVIWALIFSFAITYTSRPSYLFSHKENKMDKTNLFSRIDNDLKKVLTQKYPFIEMTWKQFQPLLSVAPEKLSFWTLPVVQGPDKYRSTTKGRLLGAAVSGQFYAHDPGSYFVKVDVSNDIIGLGCHGIQISDEWKTIQKLVEWSRDDDYFTPNSSCWPLLLVFGGNLPDKYGFTCAQDIPQNGTLIFFRTKMDAQKAYRAIAEYISTKGLCATGIENEKDAVAQHQLKNSMKGADNLMQEVTKVKEQTEKKLRECQDKTRDLILDAERANGGDEYPDGVLCNAKDIVIAGDSGNKKVTV